MRGFLTANGFGLCHREKEMRAGQLSQAGTRFHHVKEPFGENTWQSQLRIHTCVSREREELGILSRLGIRGQWKPVMIFRYETFVLSSEKVENLQWWGMTQQTTDVHCKKKEEEESKNIFSCASFRFLLPQMEQ